MISSVLQKFRRSQQRGLEANRANDVRLQLAQRPNSAASSRPQTSKNCSTLALARVAKANETLSNSQRSVNTSGVKNRLLVKPQGEESSPTQIHNATVLAEKTKETITEKNVETHAMKAPDVLSSLQTEEENFELERCTTKAYGVTENCNEHHVLQSEKHEEKASAGREVVDNRKQRKSKSAFIIRNPQVSISQMQSSANLQNKFVKDNLQWVDDMFHGVTDSRILEESANRTAVNKTTEHLKTNLPTSFELPTAYLSETQRQVFRQHFQSMDENKDGKLTVDELTERMFDCKPTPTQVKQFFRVFDLNRDKTIDEDEFVTILTLNDKLQGTITESVDLKIELDLHKLSYYIQVYKEMFELLDSSGDGRLNLEELMVVVTAGLHPDVGTNKAVMQALLNVMDVDQNGHVDFVEFLSFIPFFLQLHQAILDEPLAVANIERARMAVRAALRPGRQYQTRRKVENIWDK